MWVCSGLRPHVLPGSVRAAWLCAQAAAPGRHRMQAVGCEWVWVWDVRLCLQDSKRSGMQQPSASSASAYICCRSCSSSSSSKSNAPSSRHLVLLAVSGTTSSSACACKHACTHTGVQWAGVVLVVFGSGGCFDLLNQYSYTAKGVWALAQLAAACHVSHMQVVR